MNNLFLRHGEVENNKNIQYGSLPGYFLSENGFTQAKEIGKKIKENFKVKKIISSPILRARQTALAVNEHLGINITYSEELTEWPGISTWHGLTINEIKLTNEYKSYSEKSIDLIKADEAARAEKRNIAMDEDFMAAGGGIAKMAGDRSGPPPQSGPNSQGLQGLFNRVKKV